MKRFKIGKIIKFVVILAIVAGVGYGGYYGYKKVFAATKVTATEKTVKVTKGDIDVTISGTGTAQPISRYDIVSLVNGNILSAPFEEGMNVKAGDLLYKIDESDLSFNIEKARNSIDKLKLSNKSTTDSINDLEVYAPIDGQLTSFTINEGDDVNNNAKLGDLTDFKNLIATVPFNEQQASNIKAGQKATVVIGQFMSSVDGVVKYISNTAKSSTDNSVVVDVEISLENPGALKEGMEVSAVVYGESGEIQSPTTGKISYLNKQSVLTKTSGKVSKVYVKNEEWVKAGQKILSLTNDSLLVTNQKNGLDLRDSQLSLESQIKQMNDYNIVSPIDGRVIKKNYKVGDTIGNSSSSSSSKSSSNSNALMVVADLSRMKFTIDIDELDIAKVSIGQKVDVTSDALPKVNLVGKVTNKPLEGTTTNGVTVYSIEVTIDEPGDLMPGMNVNANITVESKKDVLVLPVSAVTQFGNRAFVNVDADQSSPAPQMDKGLGGQQVPGDQSQGDSQQTRSQRRQSVQNDGNANQGAQRSDNGQSSSKNSSKSSSGTNQSKGTSGAKANTQVGQRRPIVVGINNDNMIEVVSGLSEGDVVYVPNVQKSTSTNNNMMRGMGGMGGGMPMGGGPGGR